MPEQGDYIIHSDTWRGISLTIHEGTSKDRARLARYTFASDQGAYNKALEDMERQGFYPNVWIVWDRGDPQLYEA